MAAATGTQCENKTPLRGNDIECHPPTSMHLSDQVRCSKITKESYKKAGSSPAPTQIKDKLCAIVLLAFLNSLMVFI